MLFHITDTSQEPFHSQISRQIREKLLTGELSDGECLPTVQQLSRQLKIDTNTINRAYQELIDQGILKLDDSKNYVIDLPDKKKLELTEEYISRRFQQVIVEMKSLGISRQQLLDIIEKLIKSEE